MYQGKYVFAQLFSIISRHEFTKCVNRYDGNYKTRDFKCWQQFLCMVFGQLTYRESIRDIINCLAAHQSKIYHLGIKNLVAVSTLTRANENRDWRIWSDFATHLISVARPLYLTDNDFTLELDNTVYALDASTIDLCLSTFHWAKFRKKKGAVKLHTLMDLRGNIPVFIDITDGKTHDVHILDKLTFEAGAFYIIDKGYYDHEKSKTYIFLTNNFQINAITITLLYKNRWQIELFFKWIKQHLKIKKFWGHSENAVKTQIWIAVCTYLLVAILKKKLKIDRNLYSILQILSVSAFDKTPVNQLLSSTELHINQNELHKQLTIFDL